MKHLSLLGSTGSIGRNVCKIVEMFPEKFSIKALAAKNNLALLAEQIKCFRPEIAVVFDEKGASELKERLPSSVHVEIQFGNDGYRSAAVHNDVDMVVSAIVGGAGLLPTVAALESGKDLALANKETLVMAGDIVMRLSMEKNITILPIDSEHSAIFQCLSGQRKGDLAKILLTASGGPFLNTPQDEFVKITPKEALNHPTWQMGKKISVDSATLMNKGLEVIEAKYLFGISEKKIEVIIHPQSIVHSMVAYHDGSILAQLGVPDMKGAISYALSYPERLELKQPTPDLARIGALTFEKPDTEKFPCLALAFEACSAGETMPAVLNAANEIAVEAFLKGSLPFKKIPELIHRTMERHRMVKKPNLLDILEADRWAREETSAQAAA